MTPNEKIKRLVASVKAIKVFQDKLASSDYKVIKCYEYSLAGLDLPYDINELHAEREAIREEIRRLEEAN